ncbi:MULTISPECIES: TetR/AcrR family transcriptional regulator [unclassified Pseudomonas]|uniref:acrylate utilization transcriptional regulator AcuR n=1 Tax=unclassified Pseudomonas TaxID=196821 RepID=UPI000A1DD400|nr:MULTISPECIES: TetR/AcrR family transcriptional regulator [unclassified Pseudomonas]MCX4216471.1 TetR/AcrR family transcriptional regulator [Pseudomonas sp. MCal1]
MTDTKSPVRRGRPPKVAREHDDTREILLRRGVEMLTERGLASTGIDSILKSAQVPKGSFYHYFDSKEAFGMEVLEVYANFFARKLERHLLNPDFPPLQRLANFVEDAKSGMSRHEFRRGCLVGNLGQEVFALPDGFRVRVDAVLNDWQALVAACLEKAVAAGELSQQADCRSIAAFFWIGWEGAVLRAKLVGNVSPLDIFFSGFLAGITR